MKWKENVLMFVLMALLFGVLLWWVADAEKKELAQEERRIAQEIALQESIDAALYIGNLNSHKFHLLDCAYLPYAENRIYFSARQDAVEAGYKVCEKCNP